MRALRVLGLGLPFTLSMACMASDGPVTLAASCASQASASPAPESPAPESPAPESPAAEPAPVAPLPRGRVELPVPGIAPGVRTSLKLVFGQFRKTQLACPQCGLESDTATCCPACDVALAYRKVDLLAAFEVDDAQDRLVLDVAPGRSILYSQITERLYLRGLAVDEERFLLPLACELHVTGMTVDGAEALALALVAEGRVLFAHTREEDGRMTLSTLAEGAGPSLARVRALVEGAGEAARLVDLGFDGPRTAR